MTTEIRRLYLYHFFNSIATTVAASFLFIDRIFLRMDLSKVQIGTIKGVGFWVAMAINLLAAPYILRLQMDRQIVAVGQFLRVIVPIGFVFVHQVSDDTNVRTILCIVLMISAMTPVMLGNNSTQALCMEHIPRGEIGRHMSRITAIWNIPFLLLAIPCAWYIDHELAKYGVENDEAFYRTYLVLFVITSCFQLPSSWQIMRLKPVPDRVIMDRDVSVTALFEPFRHPRFRKLLGAAFAISVIVAMVMTFVYTFLFEAMKMEMASMGTLEAVVGLVGFGVMPLWGAMTDRFGGRSVMRICSIGVAIAFFCLVGNHPLWIWLAALLAWKGSLGLFGSGLSMGTQYLVLSLTEPKRRNIYTASVTFINGCGMLVGAVVGGHLLDWLSRRVDPAQPYEHYRIYFLFCALAFLLTGNFIGALSDGRRRVRPDQMAIEIYRRVRNFAGKTR